MTEDVDRPNEDDSSEAELSSEATYQLLERAKSGDRQALEVLFTLAAR